MRKLIGPHVDVNVTKTMCKTSVAVALIDMAEECHDYALLLGRIERALGIDCPMNDFSDEYHGCPNTILHAVERMALENIRLKEELAKR